MEQNQSSAAKQAKHVSPVQILALIFGVISCATSFVSTALSLWTFFITITKLSSDVPSVSVGAILILIALLCGLAAIVLGVIGLLLDRKKRQCSVGLVFSVIGIWLGVAGLIFLLCVAFWSFWLPVVSKMIGV